MLHRSLAAIAVVAALAGACAAPAPDADEDVSEEAITALSVTLDEDGDVLTLDDRPRLKPRARGPMTCGQRFEIDGRVRWVCARNDERLDLLLRPGEDEAVLVHRLAPASDARTSFACTFSGDDGLRCARPAPHGGGGGLTSPFSSTVAGIDIPNTHPVGASGLLLRGMAPRSPEDLDQLVAAGVGAVLVFKNQTGRGTDVADEMAALRDRGLAASRVTNIPFLWKDLPGFESPCRQTVQALAFLFDNLVDGRKTFFHCTVGEDRTGLLAAIHRLLTEDDLDAATAWDREMCERGYGAGNPQKPGFVLGKLEHGLTPLFRKLAFLVATGRLRAGDLDEEVCATDPEGDPSFAATAVPTGRLVCGTSTAFDP